MWRYFFMRIGIIGNGGHSKRIQKILKEKKLDFFIYKPKKPKYYNKKDFDQLKACDVIFLISPNNTHFEYIRKLYKGRYIFCEKPPVVTKKELIKLRKILSKKIYFNFNSRFLKISHILKERNRYKLGKLVYANLASSHGLAQKKNYKSNWRSNIKRTPKGVYEIVSIHYIDLINYLFKVSKIGKPKLLNSSKIGSSFDTSLVEIKLQNEGLINIFSTYDSSYNKNLFFLFQNGIVEQRNNLIKIKGPTLNLDNKGLFKSPKIIKIFHISENRDYKNSLVESINFFLNHVKNKKKFSKKIIDISLKSNSLII